MARFKPIKRSAWSTVSFKGKKVSWALPTVVRVHHTAGPGPKYTRTSAKKNKAAEVEKLRELERFHVNARGWAAIGYSYLIFGSGRVYEGRGFEVRGAHTLNHNGDVGVSFVGNFEYERPTPSALLAYWRLRRWLRKQGVNVHGHAPHSDTYATSCPGRFLKRALRLG